MDSQSIRNKKFKRTFSEMMPLSIFIYGLAGTIYFLIKFRESNNTIIIILLFVSIGVSVAGLFLTMYNYLKRSNEEKHIISDDDILMEIKKQLEYATYRNSEQTERLEKFEFSISKVISKLEERISQNSSHELDEKQKKVLFEKITNSIESNLTKNFYEKIGESIKYKVAEDKREQVYTLAKRFENSIARLKNEIELLGKRANINLIIGSIITVAALGLLGYFVVSEDFNSEKLLKATLHFIPRLSLVVFIELFSFFFLKLYRTSLSEIKYYQNELTNVEAQ